MTLVYLPIRHRLKLLGAASEYYKSLESKNFK
nr:MAG TPA_asm: hypothetical protein [Caudoviricetes sp.]